MHKVLQQSSSPILHSTSLGLSQADSELPSHSNDVNVISSDSHELPEETDHVDWDVRSDASENSCETEPLHPEVDMLVPVWEQIHFA